MIYKIYIKDAFYNFLINNNVINYCYIIKIVVNIFPYFNTEISHKIII